MANFEIGISQFASRSATARAKCLYPARLRAFSPKAPRYLFLNVIQ
ncbi:hypothetical protein OEZ60_08270 [Defluviimonas sp. WL0024]|uniref:Uncharacterized protein n=1 Tax=Albidovulum salinarum TaxID=2984153 RepID=A0ABT2X2S4_9RHOB|nr:hypothetical protein [Defluviimonas sp. WL0024]